MLYVARVYASNGRPGDFFAGFDAQWGTSCVMSKAAAQSFATRAEAQEVADFCAKVVPTLTNGAPIRYTVVEG